MRRPLARILPHDPIRDYLLQRVEHGMVRNREEVVAALREAGLEVPRQGQGIHHGAGPRDRGAVAPERTAVRGCLVARIPARILLSLTGTARSAFLAVEPYLAPPC